MTAAEEKFRRELAAHRELVLDGLERMIRELEPRLEAYIDGRIAEVTRRVDEVHDRALRELTRLHERRKQA